MILEAAATLGEFTAHELAARLRLHPETVKSTCLSLATEGRLAVEQEIRGGHMANVYSMPDAATAARTAAQATDLAGVELRRCHPFDLSFAVRPQPARVAIPMRNTGSGPRPCYPGERAEFTETVKVTLTEMLGYGATDAAALARARARLAATPATP